MPGKIAPNANQLKTIDAGTLQPINLIIITCPQLVEKRLSSILKSIISPLSLDLIANCQIINDTDERLFEEFSHLSYLPELWDDHISQGWLHFFENLVLMNACKLESKHSYINIEKSFIFPKRRLTNVEHSIIYRHFKAWNIASKQKGLTLILEDDAL